MPSLRHYDAISNHAAGPEFNVIGAKEKEENSSFKTNRGLDEYYNDEGIQHSSYNRNSITEVINHQKNNSTLDSIHITQRTTKLDNDKVNNILAHNLNSQQGSCAISCSANSSMALSKFLTSYRENARGAEAASGCAHQSASNLEPVALKRSRGSDEVTGSTRKKAVQCTLSQSRLDRCLKERR